jgi:hypothetical protein
MILIGREPYPGQIMGTSASLMVRFEVFMAVKLYIVEYTVIVFRVELEHICIIFYPEDGFRLFLRNIGTHLPD